MYRTKKAQIELHFSFHDSLRELLHGTKSMIFTLDFFYNVYLSLSGIYPMDIYKYFRCDYTSNLVTTDREEPCHIDVVYVLWKTKPKSDKGRGGEEREHVHIHLKQLQLFLLPRIRIKFHRLRRRSTRAHSRRERGRRPMQKI